ncbi:hypothetical protein [Schlesneria paludicola]|uniref:hypothetical protein n=1 Tax=Schlesneria paludicola TaxID=360056 RepID=UPI000299E0FA|nr:hypothetical protein [Schlesneria paludicola]
MPVRTVKGPVFTLIVGGQQIVVKHVNAKGKRCRVFAPEGVLIEPGLVTLGEYGRRISVNERVDACVPRIDGVSDVDEQRPLSSEKSQ